MIQGFKLLSDLRDLLLDCVQLVDLVGAAGVGLPFLDDAAELGGAEAGYYGLIHIIGG